jgi:two-component system, sporulation sensor kinase D
VISNIFNNVLNAQPHGGFVDISLEKKDKFLVLKISNGGNMPDTDNPDELFKPYFTTGTRGTGLGLAICRKIVKLHEGTIRIVVDDNIFITEIRLPLKG